MANEFKVKKGLIVQGSGSAILDIQGDLGQLFSITDSLTGDIFTVSDISGIPLLSVNADDPLTTIEGAGHDPTTKTQGVLRLIQDDGYSMYLDGNDIDAVDPTGSAATLYLQDYSKGLVQVGGALTAAGNITAPTFIGALSGNASTATNLASISTTFSGTYPMTVNVSGTIYSHTGVTYNGTSGALTATSFVGDLTGTASSVTVSNSTSATYYPVVWHDNSNSLYDTTGVLMFQASTGTLVSTNVKSGTTSTGCTMTYNSTDNSLDFIFD